MKKIIEEYNNIIQTVGMKSSTIGTDKSKCTDNWNLRDMVAECDYVLDAINLYDEVGPVDHVIRILGKKMLKSFIDRYEVMSREYSCVICHGSKYDN